MSSRFRLLSFFVGTSLTVMGAAGCDTMLDLISPELDMRDGACSLRATVGGEKALVYASGDALTFDGSDRTTRGKADAKNPKLRTDLSCEKTTRDDVASFRMSVPDIEKPAELYEIEVLSALLLDSTRTPKQMAAAVKEEFEFEMDADKVEEFVRQLGALGLLEGVAPFATEPPPPEADKLADPTEDATSQPAGKKAKKKAKKKRRRGKR